MSMTAGTIEDANIKGHLLAMSTLAACLTRIGRIDSNVQSPSFFRFGVQLTEKGRPGGICNAFGKTMVVGHSVHMQVFDTDDPMCVDDLVAFLVREILPPKGDPLMHTGYYFTVFPTFRCAFVKFGMLALDSGKSFFLFAKETRVSYLFTCREGRKGLESYINAHLFRAFRQAFRFTFNRERDVPLAGRRAMDGTGFHLAFDGAMVDHLDTANLGEAQAVVMREAETALREGERVVPVLALETWKPRVLSVFSHATEESLESQINPNGDVLQDLRMHRIQGRAFLFQDWKGGLLSVEREALTSLLIGLLALFEQVVIQPTTLFQRLVQLCRLVLSWKNPVLKHFTHVSSMAQTVVLSSIVLPAGSAAFIPVAEARGLSPRMR